MSVISYFGGKSSNVFIKFINSKIPKDGIKTYIEPFSGSMATYMDDPNLKFDEVIYNDKNRHQVNLYKCCQNPKEFLRYFKDVNCYQYPQKCSRYCV
jgi:site-specific DNA-adenine methylase